jgi:hypothetical protein
MTLCRHHKLRAKHIPSMPPKEGEGEGGPVPQGEHLSLVEDEEMDDGQGAEDCGGNRDFD